MEQQQLPLRLRFSIWSTTHCGVVRELVRKHGGLDVTLYRQLGNPIDPTTVAVVCDPDMTAWVVGGEPGYAGHDWSDSKYMGQRIGHVARVEPSKDRIWRLLADASMRAVLSNDGSGLVIEPSHLIEHGPGLVIGLFVPNALDADIPF